MSIKGLDGLSDERINFELQKGAKFIVYEYCISILIMTFKRPSQLHFIKADESRFAAGIVYAVISLFFGWWGIPWGPIYTIASLITNLSGGKDVTAEVLASANKAVATAGEGQDRG